MGCAIEDIVSQVPYFTCKPSVCGANAFTCSMLITLTAEELKLKFHIYLFLCIGCGWFG